MRAERVRSGRRGRGIDIEMGDGVKGTRGGGVKDGERDGEGEGRVIEVEGGRTRKEGMQGFELKCHRMDK